MYDLLIIGAGPAGLFCGIGCAAANMRVCILEKNTTAGKKLLISGSGRCNITNAAGIEKFLKSYGTASRFIKPALYHFGNKELVQFFTARGVMLTEMNDGKIFPRSQKALDILNALLEEAARTRLEIHYNSNIDALQYTTGSFRVACAGQEYTAGKLLISTGGKSYPQTGTTGDGYRFARILGHCITEPAPALTPVIVKDYQLSHCAGISLKESVIKIFRDGKISRTARGDILFTHKGLSGPCILDNSRYMQKNDVLSVQLAKVSSAHELENGFIASSARAGAKTVKAYITSLGIPERMAIFVLQQYGVPGGEILSRLDRVSRKKLVHTINSLTFTIDRLGGYDEAMVTRGGVSLAEVNPKTMESRIKAGLYFAGEVLDVDGDTGGFNLQFAFSSAKLAADSIIAGFNKR